MTERRVRRFHRLIAPRSGLALLGVAVVGAGCTGGRSDGAPEDAAATDAVPAEGVYGDAAPAVAGIPSVVLLEPSSPSGAGEQVSDEAQPTIDQLGLAFMPTQLIVRPGETVVFTNSESIGHDVHVVFSDTDSTVLHVDTDPGSRHEFVFEREGGYDVICDHHLGMRGFVYVTAAPYATFADREGHFRIFGVTPGSFTASAWSLDPSLRVDRTIEVTGEGTEVKLRADQRGAES